MWQSRGALALADANNVVGNHKGVGRMLLQRSPHCPSDVVPPMSQSAVHSVLFPSSATGLSSRDKVLREAVIILGLLVLTLALRAPFFSNIDEDEAFFALIGRDWLNGALPYVDRFDVKPPGLFALYALAQVIGGASVATYKCLIVVAVAASAYGLLLIGRQCFSPLAGSVAAALYPFYSLAMHGVNAPVGLLLNAFVIFAALAALRVDKGRLTCAFASGLLLGFAFTVKQSVAFEAFAIMCAMLLRPMPPDRRMATFAAFAVGGAAVPVVFACYFLAHGAFGALWTATIVSAVGRLNGDNVSFTEGLYRFPFGLAPALVLVLGASMVAVRWTRLQPEHAHGIRLCLLWALGAAAGVIGMRSMYDHYFLPLIPPLLVLASVSLALAVERLSGRQAIVVTISAFVAAAAFPIFINSDDLTDGAVDLAAVRAAERAAIAAGLRPGDPVIVVNRGLLFSYETGAVPAGRFFHPMHLLCEFPIPGRSPLDAAFAAEPKFVLVANTRFSMVCQKPERMTALKAHLDVGFVRVAQVSGVWDAYELYVRTGHSGP